MSVIVLQSHSLSNSRPIPDIGYQIAASSAVLYNKERELPKTPYETLFPKTVIPEHIRKGRSGYFEFGEFGKDAFERDSRFEGQRFGV